METGEVWRKAGPTDWAKVVGFYFDDGWPGVRIHFSNYKGNWKKQTWFWPCKDYDQFCKDMTRHFRKKVD